MSEHSNEWHKRRQRAERANPQTRITEAGGQFSDFLRKNQPCHPGHDRSHVVGGTLCPTCGFTPYKAEDTGGTLAELLDELTELVAPDREVSLTRMAYGARPWCLEVRRPAKATALKWTNRPDDDDPRWGIKHALEHFRGNGPDSASYDVRKHR